MTETQKIIAILSRASGVEEIDPAAVRRFVEATINSQPVTPQDSKHAAVLLWAILRGLRAGEDMNGELRRILKTRKSRSKIFDPKTVFMGSPEFTLVERYVRGEITHTEAVQEFANLHPASTRQTEAWIAAIKPTVQRTVTATDALLATSQTAK